MNLLNDFGRLEKFISLIEQHKTGTPANFADALHISRRSLYNIIEEFKAVGVEIEYSREICSYYFANNVSFEMKFCIHFEKGAKLLINKL